jgi:ankyrin repeat protein
MSWSQDVIISILFPYLLPSLPVCQKECWPKHKFRRILTYLLVSLGCCCKEEIRDTLEFFVRKTLSTSFQVKKPLSHRRQAILNHDLCFLANITARSSFRKLLACKSNLQYLYATSFLIENKANIHAEHELPLRDSSAMGFTETVALLIKHKADIHVCNNICSSLACQNGRTNTLSLFLDYKAVDINRCLFFACKYGYKDMVVLLLGKEGNLPMYGYEGFIEACARNNKDVVLFLLEQRVDVNMNNDSALRLASSHGHEDIVHLLIEHKANVHAENNQAILWANENAHKDVVSLLLEHKSSL